ncbi:MAG: ATP synthase F0 subunit B [Candidatus Velthaea sp.]|jgi:F-type H+-transporting ATPase subunit b
MLELGGTVVVQIVNFVVFLAIMNVVFFRPVGAAIAKRRAYIEGIGHDIESLQGDAKALRGQADERRAAARRRVDELLTAARISASNEAETIVSEAAQKAQGLIDGAHRQVAEELEKARSQEAALVAALSNDMVARAFGTEAA